MVEDIAPRKAHNCNGSLEEFSFTFPLIVSSDLAVYLKNTSTNAVTLLTETTDYVVKDPDGAEGVLADFENGGSITTTVETPYSNIYQIILERSVPYTQESDFTEGMPSLYQTFENALDKLTMEVQQLRDLVGRSPYCPADDPTTLDMEMPNATTRAGKLFGFDDNGEPVAVTEIEGVTVTDFGNALLSANDAEDGREALELENVNNVEQMPLSYLDTDTALTANSDVKVASQKATKSYVDTLIDSIPRGGGSITQTVLSSKISSGLPVFITDPDDGLKVGIDTDDGDSPIIISFANGIDETGELSEIGAITEDTQITGLTDNATNYLYAERDPSTGLITLGATVIPPSYVTAVPVAYTEASGTQTGSDAGIGYATNDYFKSQGFKSTILGAISAVTVKIYKTGTPTGTLTLEIHGDNAGKPNNTVLTNGTSTAKNEADLQTSATNETFTFSNPVIILEGVQYHIVLKFAGRGLSTSNFSKWVRSSSGSYANGAACNSDNSATPVWAVSTGYDCEFSMNIGISALQKGFVIPEQKLYEWSGSAWVAKQIVFIGEAVTASGQVTSVVNYALRGMYNSALTAIVASNTYTFSHNLGVSPPNLDVSAWLYISAIQEWVPAFPTTFSFSSGEGNFITTRDGTHAIRNTLVMRTNSSYTHDYFDYTGTQQRANGSKIILKVKRGF